jgi:hypothetical protein
MGQKLLLISVLSILLSFLLFSCFNKKVNYKTSEIATIYYLPVLFFSNMQIREDVKHHHSAKRIVTSDKEFIDSLRYLLEEMVMFDSIHYPLRFDTKILIEIDNKSLLLIGRGGNILYKQNYYIPSDHRIRNYLEKKYPEIWNFHQFTPEEINENRRLLGIDTLPINDSQTE